MLDPVLGGVFSQREVLDVVTINAIVQFEEDSKTCLSENSMSSLEWNVIPRDFFSARPRKSVRSQKFFDREVSKLNDPRIPILGYDHQTRACRHHCLFLILPTPTTIQLRDPFFAEVKCKDFCEFLDSKWANSRYETLHQSTSMSLIRLPDLPQYPLVCPVQTFR